MDESEAIQRIRNGEISALEPLVRAHQLRAVRTAYLITRDRQIAEDIVQDALIRAFERIGQLRPGSPFAPWFLRIVVNDALKAAQRGRRWVSLPDDASAHAVRWDAPGAAPDPEDILLENEMRSEVWIALGALAPEQRTLLVLRYYVEWRETELAEWLQTPVGTVKWRLHEARRKLRMLLSESRPCSTPEPSVRSRS